MLLLEERGKLSLEDDVRKYIPEVPGFSQKITLRHLDSHTSGLMNDCCLTSILGWTIGDVLTMDGFLKLLSSQN